MFGHACVCLCTVDQEEGDLNFLLDLAENDLPAIRYYNYDHVVIQCPFHALIILHALMS